MIDGIHHQMQALLAAKSDLIGQHSPKNSPLSSAKAEGSVGANLETAEQVSGIARKYDVRNMSPREMSVMSQELYQSKAISFEDHAILSFQPELGAGVPGVAHQADTPKDFMVHWEQQLKFHEARGEMAYAQIDRRMLNILGNLAAISLPGNS